MCLTNSPITIPIPDKSAEIVIRIYATFSGSLTLIFNKGKESRNNLFQNITRELGRTNQLSTHTIYNQMAF